MRVLGQCPRSSRLRVPARPLRGGTPQRGAPIVRRALQTCSRLAPRAFNMTEGVQPNRDEGSGAVPQKLQVSRSGAPVARRTPAARRTRRAPCCAVKQRHGPTRAQHDRRRATQSREKRRSLPQKLQVPRSGAPVARRNPAARRTRRAPCRADEQRYRPTRIQPDRRHATQSREKNRRFSRGDPAPDAPCSQ